MVWAAHELFDKEGASLRFVRNHFGHLLRGPIVGAVKRETEPLRLRGIERPDGEAERLGSTWPALFELDEELRRPRVLFTVRQDEQDRRRLRRTHQLEKHSHTVPVAPLNVVDGHNQRLPRRQARCEIAQRPESALPNALWIV